MHALTFEVDKLREFILKMVRQGAITDLLAVVLSVFTRIHKHNVELRARLEAARSKRPPNESWRRLQMEFAFMGPPKQDASGSDGEGETDPSDAGKPDDDGSKKKNKRGPKNPHRHGRPKLPEHLERVEEPVQRVPDEQRTCPLCNIEAQLLRIRKTEKLDRRPVQYIARVEQVEVLACPKCHEYVVSAPNKDEVVDRGILGNDLLVEALVDHYQDAMPWERMQRHARQQGVPLSANTLAKSCGALIDLFDPIVRHIFHKAVTADYFAFDATTMPVLDFDAPLGIYTGALWLVQGDHCYSCFLAAPSGHASHLEDRLKGYKIATAMCDGSATNNLVDRAGADRGGCNAHARRKLVGALRKGDLRATRGLELFAALFHVEAESKRAGESLDERFERRQRDSAPLVAELKQWVDEQVLEVEPKSALGKALRYIKRQWKRLTRFMHNPRMEMTNNEVERDLRTWVLDRKTWLFCGHDESAQRAADALTLITTCNKLGIDPRRYLRDTLDKILAGEKNLGALLPENYKPDIAPHRQHAPPSPDAAAA